MPVTPRIWGGAANIFVREEDLKKTGAWTALAYWPLKDKSRPAEVNLIGGQVRSILLRAGIADIEPPAVINQINDFAARFNDTKDPKRPVAVILDEEPSKTIGEFLAATDRQLRMLPGAPQLPFGEEVLRLQSGTISMLVPYARFYPVLANDRKVLEPQKVLITPSEPDVPQPLPLVLTNATAAVNQTIRQTLGAPLDQLVSESYLLSLLSTQDTRCDPQNAFAVDQFKAVLLNSYLTDSENPFIVLGLLGHLLFEERVPAGGSRDRSKNAKDVFIDILQQRGVRANPAFIEKWLRDETLRLKRPYQQGLNDASDVRSEYARYIKENTLAEAQTFLVSTFEAAQQALTTNDATAKVKSCADLKTARSKLATIAAITLPQACGKRKRIRGLWSSTDLEPFFYLAAVDALMREASCKPNPK